jgi:hypothetical protein
VILRVILPPTYLDASACSDRDREPSGPLRQSTIRRLDVPACWYMNRSSNPPSRTVSWRSPRGRRSRDPQGSRLFVRPPPSALYACRHLINGPVTPGCRTQPPRRSSSRGRPLGGLPGGQVDRWLSPGRDGDCAVASGGPQDVNPPAVVTACAARVVPVRLARPDRASGLMLRLDNFHAPQHLETANPLLRRGFARHFSRKLSAQLTGRPSPSLTLRQRPRLGR